MLPDWSSLHLLGKHPAGDCWLEGGRSSLLESAQEATLSSVATPYSSVNATPGPILGPPLLLAAHRIMDFLFTPWRYAYITSSDKTVRAGVPKKLEGWPGDLGCVFCNLMAAIDYSIQHGMAAEEAEAAGGLVWRGRHCFIALNAFPYTSGHVMILPYAHLDRLAKMPLEAAHEMMDLAQKTERVLNAVYHPHGFNFGMNLGEAAGAGVAGHLHLHAMPRWVGDTNFMTVVGETRVLPEELETTWRRLRAGFAGE